MTKHNGPARAELRYPHASGYWIPLEAHGSSVCNESGKVRIVHVSKGLVHVYTYNALFFVTLAAVLGPWVSVRIFKSIIPSVVIEIALGYFIGSHGLHVASDTSSIQFIANFGFSYLMFLSGMELDFELAFTPKGKGTPSWVRGVLFFGVTLLISFADALGLSLAGFKLNLVMTTLLLSTTSVGLVTPLKESGWIREDFGQELVLYALIADIATLMVFSGYITMHSTGNAFRLLLIMVLLVFFGFVYRLLHVAKRFAVFRVLQNTSSEVGIRAAFALILAYLASAQTLGTEVIIGAFLAGAIISLLSESHSLLTRKLNSIGYGFFVPIFFVHVG